MNKTLFPILLLVLLFGCNSRYKYWDISQFTMDPAALKNEEKIKLLYTSHAPDDNKNREYYIHLIVISQESGDTVNVLTTAENGFKATDRDSVFNFFDVNSPVTKFTEMSLEDIKEGDNIQFENIKLKKIDKVARDPKFDNLASNHHSTIIGSIGKKK